MGYPIWRERRILWWTETACSCRRVMERGALYRMGALSRNWSGRGGHSDADESGGAVARTPLWSGRRHHRKASLKCVEFETGTEKWAVPDFGNGGLVVAGGHLLALNGTGELVVAPAGALGIPSGLPCPGSGRQDMDGPGSSEGRIFCRNTLGFVVCLDVSKP